jgi:hypothetical protein
MTFLPRYSVQSNQSIQLSRGNNLDYIYMPVPNVQLPYGASGYLTFFNSYGNVLDVVEADNTATGGNCLRFQELSTVTDLFPAGTSWTITVDMNDGEQPRLLMQGIVTRVEAPFPSLAPANVLDTVQYSYTFATPGVLSDVAWNVLSGTPIVYNNSTLNLPNAVAAGAPSDIILDGGDASVASTSNPWERATMLYYAPLPADAVSLSYNVVTGGALSLGGETWVIISSAYDMNTCVAFFHQQDSSSGTPTIGIATGSGPTIGGAQTQWDVQVSVPYTTTNMDNFIATYNPLTDTYALWLFGGTAPLLTWTDSADLIPHGPGFRYLGFSFESGALAPGVEICNWYANPNVTYTGTELPESHSFTANTTYTPLPWAQTIDLVGVGGGGGGHGEDLVDIGAGGNAGEWGATTLTVGATGPTGIKAGTAIGITVGTGGAAQTYFLDGRPGTSTTFSWVDADEVAQTLTCAGGAGGPIAFTLTGWGLSPGNLTFNGQDYIGGAIQTVWSANGHAPGGGGAGAAPFLWGAPGAAGEAWVVEHPDGASTPLTPSNVGVVPQAFANSGNYTTQATSTTVDLVGVGGGGGGHGEDLVDIGIGGNAGLWNATTLTVGGTGPTGIKAGSVVTFVVGDGGGPAAYFLPGISGADTTFSWVDAAETVQTMTCPGGDGGNLGITLTGIGKSPGPLDFNGQHYVGGASQPAWSGTGHAPGGGGGGAAPFLEGGPGGNGGVWIMEHQPTS